MTNAMLIYTGSAVIILWGIAHLIPTKAVVNGFEPVSEDNRRIITMEWMAEGLTLLLHRPPDAVCNRSPGLS